MNHRTPLGSSLVHVELRNMKLAYQFHPTRIRLRESSRPQRTRISHGNLGPFSPSVRSLDWGHYDHGDGSRYADQDGVEDCRFFVGGPAAVSYWVAPEVGERAGHDV